MTLVAFVSGRSPGLTTAVHALALTWPSARRALVAELDPDGGTLAVRHQLPPEPGLTTLAAAGRRGLVPDIVLQHCRVLADGTPVLLGPTAPERAMQTFSLLGPRLATALDAIAGVDVLADCGRVDTQSPALEVIRAARYVVAVVTPTIEGVAHVHTRLSSLGLPPGRVAAVTVGQRPYRPDDVGAALGVPVIGVLADDRKGADALAEGRPAINGQLLRSATVLGRQLAARLVPLVETNNGHHPPPLPGPVGTPGLTNGSDR
jgi:hypothetical protein